MRGTSIRFGNFGKDISQASNYMEALQAGGLDWSVMTAPVLTRVNGKEVEVPGYQTVLRADNAYPLGVVGDRYTPFSNRAAFKLSDEFAKQGAQFIRAGTFNEGAGTFLSMKLPGGIKVGLKDDVEKFLTLVNTHDGTQTYKALLTPFRIFCSNQLRMAFKKGDSVSIRHTQSGEVRLEEAEKTLKLANTFYGKFNDMANQLYKMKYTDTQMSELASHMFPSKHTEEDAEFEEVPTRTENNRKLLTSLFDGGMGHKETGIQGTAWGSLNALCEYVDHHRATRGSGDNEAVKDRARTTSAWFGSGAQLKSKGFDYILDQVGLKKLN